VLAEMSGGGALEKAHERRIDVIACCEELPDLRGPMVIKSLQAQHGEAVGLVYSQPGGEGHIVRYLKGRAEDAERPYSGPPHLVRRIEQIIEQLGATVRDRKIIQAFRAENADFFRRFAELKLRISRLID
jgi:DNA-binding NarL/FixJ family response regulator